MHSWLVPEVWKAGSIRNRDISDILTASIATTLQAYAIPEKRKGWFLRNEKFIKNNKNDKKVKNIYGSWYDEEIYCPRKKILWQWVWFLKEIK